ncbi:MAG: hypothetical protein K6T63_03970 [Alicyclobacillus herbarius]|uniref:hypothetical protein n=1 Tax=Alicyclobacillus herbarius TaxID=122960 RepID=UPI002355903A|nr:hypothetical protein [Alicyclobacillus herbarius]MCL6631768.1 hypothetical protein [Alicyclobacillus herbarius]
MNRHKGLEVVYFQTGERQRARVIDLVLLLEIAWCSVFFGCRGRTRASLSMAGMLVAGYSAPVISGWLAEVLVPPGSRVMAWLTQQVAAPPTAVPVLSAFLPAHEVAVAYSTPGQWMALTLLRGLLTTAITLAVFLLFVITSYLVDVYRRTPDVRGRFGGWSPTTLTLGAGCGVYWAFLTAVSIADLSWIRPFSFLAEGASTSLGLHAAAFLLEAVHHS